MLNLTENRKVYVTEFINWSYIVIVVPFFIHRIFRTIIKSEF
jgi:hypothetical protein